MATTTEPALTDVLDQIRQAQRAQAEDLKVIKGQLTDLPGMKTTLARTRLDIRVSPFSRLVVLVGGRWEKIGVQSQVTGSEVRPNRGSSSLNSTSSSSTARRRLGILRSSVG